MDHSPPAPSPIRPDPMSDAEPPRVASGQTVNATRFKAECLDILDQLSARQLTRVTITKRGRIVAVLSPPADAADTIRALHGCMRGSVVLPPDVDLTAPAMDEPLLADHGILHR